jgi:hypothetical protein
MSSIWRKITLNIEITDNRSNFIYTGVPKVPYFLKGASPKTVMEC